MSSLDTAASSDWSDDSEPDAVELELCRQGDRAALSRVIAPHIPSLQATLSRFIAWHEDRDDVLQRTLVAAIESFPRFRGHSKVRTWLIGIAINTARHERRRLARRGAIETQADETSLQVVADGRESLERTLQTRELVARAEDHLDKLSEKVRETYVLHVLLGHTLAEVAEILEIPEMTAKSRVLRARQLLAQSLAQDPELRERIVQEGQQS